MFYSCLGIWDQNLNRMFLNPKPPRVLEAKPSRRRSGHISSPYLLAEFRAISGFRVVLHHSLFPSACGTAVRVEEFRALGFGR